jgi:hypothetical protein
MIDSWKSLVYTLDQMRQLQKKPAINRNPELFFRLKKAEADVDECIARKLEEWAPQTELFEGEVKA